MYGLTLLTDELKHAEECTKKILELIRTREYDKAIQTSKSIGNEITQLKERATENHVKNEGFIYSVFFALLNSLATYWKLVELEKYYDSWCSLQDTLDCLRQLKRFYNGQCLTISFLTKQLLSLEKAYPYKYFSSCGFVVDRFECSICSRNIDSDDCAHMKGQLYAGEMAVAIARKIKNLDHVAIVTNPKNKRLVVAPDDSRQQFNLFRLLISDFHANKLSPLGFSQVKIVESKRIDENHVRAPRNSPCYCGSGKKYKHCCIESERMPHIHMDLFTGDLLGPTLDSSLPSHVKQVETNQHCEALTLGTDDRDADRADIGVALPR